VEAKTLQKATFAAGCFWHVEDAFRRLEGVTDAKVGYTGGFVENPDYKLVCTDTTGHAEALEVTFDPDRISYEDLVEFFWTMHDPTQVNRQGPDWGKQYRTAIFVHDADQREIAEKSKQRLSESGKYSKPIATEIADASTFWEAEEYHQQYYAKRGIDSCQI
jgi:peptide-methionine (S)-S-oxide reductase